MNCLLYKIYTALQFLQKTLCWLFHKQSNWSVQCVSIHLTSSNNLSHDVRCFRSVDGRVCSWKVNLGLFSDVSGQQIPEGRQHNSLREKRNSVWNCSHWRLVLPGDIQHLHHTTSSYMPPEHELCSPVCPGSVQEYRDVQGLKTATANFLLLYRAFQPRLAPCFCSSTFTEQQQEEAILGII